ncbi:hypothetical protein QTP70_032744, partial [Hemibagrus guttatus]
MSLFGSGPNLPKFKQAPTTWTGEDSFELHSVDLGLEAMEKQIRDLQVKQDQLRQRKVTLESSRTDAHLSQVNSQREDLSPSPPPVFEISSRNRFTPLHKTECDVVIIRNSIVWHVRATTAKGKACTRCLPGARVLDVTAQVPAILNKNIGAVVLHAGTNDIRLRQTPLGPGGEGTHHITHDEDHHVRTTSHIPARNQE